MILKHVAEKKCTPLFKCRNGCNIPSHEKWSRWDESDVYKYLPTALELKSKHSSDIVQEFDKYYDIIQDCKYQIENLFEKYDNLFQQQNKVYTQKLLNEIVENNIIIEYYSKDNIKSKKFYKCGKLHNVISPALTEYYENSNMKFCEYYYNGKLHNVRSPARIEYNEDGSIKLEEWYLDGEKLPTEYMKDGGYVSAVSSRYMKSFGFDKIYFRGNRYTPKKFVEIHHTNNESNSYIVSWYEYPSVADPATNTCYVGYHRENGPAKTVYYPNGNIMSEEWYINNRPQYRGNYIPSTIQYYENGTVKVRQWFNENGTSYREIGPHTINYYPNGNIRCQCYRNNETGKYKYVEYNEDGSRKIIE